VLEPGLPDPGRSPAAVEHARRVVFAHDLGRELASVEEPRAEGALKRVVLVVEVVKRERLATKVLAYASRRVARGRHTPDRTRRGDVSARPAAAAARRDSCRRCARRVPWPPRGAVRALRPAEARRAAPARTRTGGSRGRRAPAARGAAGRASSSRLP